MPSQYARERNGGGGNPNKKKFGKNLNHALAKPAAPPIANIAADRNTQNGLLLLSTKKSSAGLLASKTNATISAVSTNGSATNGTNSNTVKSRVSLNLQSQPNPSTHDVLLSAVVGASQTAEQKLDAWGVAEQMKDHQQYGTSEELFVEHHHEGEEKYSEQENRPEDYGENGGTAPDDSWDEYGGRGRSGSGANNGNGAHEVDDQVAYMSRLAKERAQIKSQEEEARVVEQKARAAQRLKDLEQKKANGSKNGSKNNEARTVWEPEIKNSNNNNKPAGGKNGKESFKNGKMSKGEKENAKEEQQQVTEPMIHLSSYEDRDRGERSTERTAPRMLFDPKKGCMVEVKQQAPKAETSGNAGGSGGGGGKQRVKERGRGGAKAKKEIAASPVVVIKNGRSYSNVSNKPKIGVGRREAASVAVATRIMVNAQYEKKKVNPGRRFPRTCGVLFRRDGYGNLRSVDECDGDLDFGAHSVPGGRVRNPDAYVEWMDQKEHEHEGYGYGDVHLVSGFGDSTHGVTLETGYTPAAEEAPLVMEWVKPDDKIELVTGIDDSPTLKPTAREFAPSEAALKAAAAAAASASSVNNNSDDGSSLLFTGQGEDDEDDEDGLLTEDDVDEDDDNEGDGHDGLGYDPYSGFDFMGSPVHVKSPEEIATAEFPPLSLDEPMFSVVGEGTSLSRPLFGFGASGAWGSNHRVHDDVLSGWGGGSGGIGLFGPDVFRSDQKNPEPPQFLATSASGSWDPSSVPGLDCLPTINVADHATGPAD